MNDTFCDEWDLFAKALRANPIVVDKAKGWKREIARTAEQFPAVKAAIAMDSVWHFDDSAGLDFIFSKPYLQFYIDDEDEDGEYFTNILYIDLWEK